MATDKGSGNASAGGQPPERHATSKRRATSSWLSRAFAWCEDHYGLDLRSLAVLRMGLGYLLLSDLVRRAFDLRAHYTDVGVLPRERWIAAGGQKLYYSLHMLGGDTVSQVLLFVVAGVFASMLLVGYRTRLATFISWVLLCSLHSRNGVVLQGGDDLLRVMLFWSMFVPQNARFSVDAVLAERHFLKLAGSELPPQPGTHRKLGPRLLSLGSMALVLQLLSMYIASAALKTGSSWHGDGSAISIALHHQAFATAFGQWFRELPPSFLQGLTWQVWWLETTGALLFFIPWNTYWWRTLGAFAFIGFHFGLFLTMELGHFPWVAIVCWLSVLPSWFWDVPVRRVSQKTGLLQKFTELSLRIQAAIARHQKWFGPPGRLPRVRPTWLGSLVLVVFASLTGYGTAYAMTHGSNLSGDRFDPLLLTRLYANWGMFAPNPPTSSGWFVTVAKQKSGEEVDVWNDGQSVSFDPPPLPSATYRNQRWRKLGDNILSDNHKAVRSSFLRWLCLEWNEEHEGPQRIESITLYHMAQTANSPAKGYGPLSKNQLARENCPALP